MEKEKKKYLLDASIIASSIEEFKRKYLTDKNNVLVLSDLTFRELEDRKKDFHCSYDSKSFTRFLIDLFVKDLASTEVFIMECENSDNRHIDEELVTYAKDTKMTILTCDKGMALWCRFYDVKCELLEVRLSSKQISLTTETTTT